MKSTTPYSIHPKHLQNAQALRRAKTSDAAETPTPPPTAATIRTTSRDFVNPIDYQHPFEAMARFAQRLAMRYDAVRACHAYYRQLRLLQEHFAADPALLLKKGDESGACDYQEPWCICGGVRWNLNSRQVCSGCSGLLRPTVSQVSILDAQQS